MRRTFTLVAAALLLSTTFTFPANAHHKDGPCHQIHWFDPYYDQGRVGPVAEIIRCAVRRWPVPGGATKALAVARCESGLRPDAVGGDNLGTFQHKARYWRDRAKRYLRPSWDVRPWRVSAFNGWANVIVSIRMAHDRNIGWWPWSCA